MRKYSNYLMIAIVAKTMAFAACKKDPEPITPPPPPPPPPSEASVITAQNVINGNNEIATAAAFAYWSNYYDDGVDVIATGEYRNNGFKLTLPETLDNKYLLPVYLFWDGNIELSNSEAKLGRPQIQALNADRDEIGEFFMWGEKNETLVEAYYLYADRNFTMKGRNEYSWYSIEYDCSFKKGWNIIYWIEEAGADELFTTQKPSGITLNWEFYEYEKYSLVRFRKVNDNWNCIAMGLGDYYGVDQSYDFGYYAGISYHYYVSSGNNYIWYYDDDAWDWSRVFDHYFAPYRSYTVINNGYNYTVVEDDYFAKSMKSQKSPFMRGMKKSKGKNISKMKSFSSAKSKVGVK